MDKNNENKKINTRATIVNTDSRSTQIQTPKSRKTSVKNNSRSTESLSVNKETSSLNIGDIIDGYKIINPINVVSGQAYIYIAEKNNQKFALKYYKNEEGCIDKEVVQVLQDKISHPNVIKIVASGFYKEKFYTVTPFYNEGAVIDHLDEIDPNILKTKYIPQLNEALQAIHEAGIFHCDIKPHNFYFTDNRNSIIVGDFGIALSASGNFSKKSKLGTYIPKRELQRREATMAYLSSEGDEYAASWVDYYALGMSILNMAHGRDVYEDVDDTTIRDELMNNPIRISESIDSELAMLITKLLDRNHEQRIGYDGVKKWCHNTSCYGKYRHKNIEDACSVHIENAVFNGNQYFSTEDYVEALTTLWNKGLEYYKKGGVINDISRAPDVTDAIIKDFSEISENYSKNENIGFALTLMRLNPAKPFCFEDINFSDFNGYVKYLARNYNKMNDLFFDENIIIQQIKNEASLKLIKNEKIVLNTINSIFDCKALSRQNKMEMICNYFSSENSILLNGKKYEQIADIANVLFANNLQPSNNSAIFNDVFLNFLISKSKEFKEKETELKGIFSLKDEFSRAAKFSLFLTNLIYCYIDYHKLQNFSDVVDYAKILYETKKDCSVFVNLLKDGKIAKYYSQFNSPNKNILQFLNSLKEFTGSNQEALALFYNKTQKEAIFIFKNKTIANLQDLFDFLAKQNDLQTISAELQSSNEFKYWMEGNGYDIFKD